MEQKINPKGLAEYLDDDPSLKREMTYEEFNNSITTGFDDSGIEEAFETYCKVMDETGVKPKGVMQCLDEDSFLSRKMTYEEFHNSIKTGFDDNGIEEAFKTYCKVKDGQVKK